SSIKLVAIQQLLSVLFCRRFHRWKIMMAADHLSMLISVLAYRACWGVVCQIAMKLNIPFPIDVTSLLMRKSDGERMSSPISSQSRRKIYWDRSKYSCPTGAYMMQRLASHCLMILCFGSALCLKAQNAINSQPQSAPEVQRDSTALAVVSKALSAVGGGTWAN